jgi:hypothetical protein
MPTRPVLAVVALLLAVAGVIAPTVAQSRGVTLVCTSDSFAWGDTVTATWINDTDSSVVAGGHPPYDIYHADSGQLVCMGGLPWEFHLGPHSSAELSWDERDCEFQLVPPGPYLMRISFIYNEDFQHIYQVQDGFEILAPASAPEGPPGVIASSWGVLKRRYR